MWNSPCFHQLRSDNESTRCEIFHVFISWGQTTSPHDVKYSMFSSVKVRQRVHTMWNIPCFHQLRSDNESTHALADNKWSGHDFADYRFCGHLHTSSLSVYLANGLLAANRCFKIFSNSKLNCTNALPSGGIDLVIPETERFRSFVILAKLFVCCCCFYTQHTFFTYPQCGVAYG